MHVMVANNSDGIRDGLRAVAADVLFRFGSERPETSIVGQARNKHTEVRVVVRAVNSGDDRRGGRHVGLWLSTTENLILTKLGADTLTRVELARRCGVTCDPSFKALVRNLIDRQILMEADDGPGVRAVQPV